MSGTVHGNSFQIGDVAGGININNYYGAPPPHAPLSQPPPATPPTSPPPFAPAAIPYAMPARPRKRWPRAVGEWLLSFGPIFLLAAVPGGIAMSIAGDSSVGARLASLVIGLAIVGLVGLARWLATRRRRGLSLGMFMLVSLDRLAFKRLGTAGAPALAFVIVLFGGATITGLAQQPQPSADGSPSAVPFALLFCALVVLVAARRLKRG